MDVKVGDKISIDAKRVGQPRRFGVVKDITDGLSGTRYTVEWEDGHESSFAPQAGNLTVESRSRKRSGGTKKKTSSRSKKGKATSKSKTSSKKRKKPKR